MPFEIAVENCSHPKNKRVFVGLQTDVNGNPKLRLYNCQDCGTTIAEPIAFGDSIWEVLGQLKAELQELKKNTKSACETMQMFLK